MSYDVHFTERALDDLKRLFSFLEERDQKCANRAIAAFAKALCQLEDFPWSCRQVEDQITLRELIVKFGRMGYVCLYRIRDERQVWVIAVRHQRQQHYG